MWGGVGGVGWLSGGWNWMVGVCGCSKWVEGFRGVDVHSCDVAVGGHDFVEFFGVSVPRWNGDCRIIGKCPDGSLAKAFVDDTEKAIGGNRKYEW